MLAYRVLSRSTEDYRIVYGGFRGCWTVSRLFWGLLGFEAGSTPARYAPKCLLEISKKAK